METGIIGYMLWSHTDYIGGVHNLWLGADDLDWELRFGLGDCSAVGSLRFERTGSSSLGSPGMLRNKFF